MKKLHAIKPNTPVVPQPRSFRRFVKKAFASFLKCQDGFQGKVLQKLQDIEDMIEIMAREMARQGKNNK